MGRLHADLTPLLPRMKAARKKVKPGEVITGGGLAEQIGTTWRILKARIVRDAQFPVMERGADGKAWQFEARAALDYLISHTAEQAKRRAARSADRARMAGFAPVSDDNSDHGTDRALTESSIAGDAADEAAQARALKALAEAQMLTHKLKVQQGEYVRADQHRAILHNIMTTMQTEMMSMSSRLDQTGAWPVGLREDVETYQRNVLLHLQRAVESGLKQ